MGALTYGTREIPVEDRLLAHLSVVMTQKLRRREGFLLTLPSGDRRLHAESFWISANSDLSFSYSGNRIPSFNQDWLEKMMNESFSSQGLDLTKHAEPAAAPRPVAANVEKTRSAPRERQLMGQRAS
ncbi:ATP-dependent DNA ligase [Labedella endophytica]|jgi:hypothetical protein|uniref:DUF7882 family protein n=1 Tax=Labedella endophytica TaxID=1523160 RepID=UPI001AA0418C|nr:ATP-dependent DNA ligase [Labedella endophytica]